MQVHIKDRPKLELLPNGKSAKLLEDFTVMIDGEDITVPKCFQTDFASVPRLAIGLCIASLVILTHIAHNPVITTISFFASLYIYQFGINIGLYTKAAIVHDYLYYKAEKQTAKAYYLEAKKRADSIFYNIMLYLGVRKDKAILMYLAVKFFGFKKRKAA